MDASQTFSIVVDDRESAGTVLAALQRRECVQLRVERLPVGDYRIDDALLFERKTLRDLVASIKDGRLFAQGLRLAEAPLRASMILEGRSQDLADSRMQREAMQGAVVTLTLFMGIPLLRSMDPEETASLMLFAARQGRAFAWGALPRKARRPGGKVRVQNHILQGLPGDWAEAGTAPAGSVRHHRGRHRRPGGCARLSARYRQGDRNRDPLGGAGDLRHL
jgi:ERCC4-type nuclease